MPVLEIQRYHQGAWIGGSYRAEGILRFEEVDQGEREQLEDHACAMFVGELGHDTFGVHEERVELATTAARLIVKGKRVELVDKWKRALLSAQGVPPKVHDRFLADDPRTAGEKELLRQAPMMLAHLASADCEKGWPEGDCVPRVVDGEIAVTEACWPCWGRYAYAQVTGAEARAALETPDDAGAPASWQAQGLERDQANTGGPCDQCEGPTFRARGPQTDNTWADYCMGCNRFVRPVSGDA